MVNIDINKIQLNIVANICKRQRIIIEQQDKMIKILESKLFLAKGKVHPFNKPENKTNIKYRKVHRIE